jgi:hypothetical protein
MIVSRRQNKFGLPKSVCCSFLKQKRAAACSFICAPSIIYSASSNQIESFLFDIGAIRLSGKLSLSGLALSNFIFGALER